VNGLQVLDTYKTKLSLSGKSQKMINQDFYQGESRNNKVCPKIQQYKNI
jgi:hypothetical protein